MMRRRQMSAEKTRKENEQKKDDFIFPIEPTEKAIEITKNMNFVKKKRRSARSYR